MKTQKVNHTKRYIFRKKRFWAALLFAQFFLFFTVSKFNFVINLSDDFFEVQKQIHQAIFSAILFSVGDLFYAILIIYLCLELYFYFRKKNSASLKRFLITLNILYCSYQLFWGLLYFQKPIIHQLSKEPIDDKDVENLAFQLLEHCKTLRNHATEDKNGVFKTDETSKLVHQIIAAQRLIPKDLNNKKITSIESVKPSLLGNILSYTGISGYYNPFTAEAQYNSHLPDTSVGFTLSHEMAHQLGYTREQEASFIGYLACQKSNNINLQYSANLYALKSTLSALNNRNPKLVEKIIKNYSDGMKRDRAYEKQFASRYYGMWSDVFYWTNDLFLKSNRQDGSVSYSYFTELLLRYELYYNNKKESYQKIRF